MTVRGSALATAQQWVYQRLSGDAQLMSQLTGIFDEAAVPETQPCPYLVIGQIQELQQDTLSHRHYQQSLPLHVWTEARGMQSIHVLLERLNILLHRPDPQSLPDPTSTTGPLIVGCYYEQAEQLQDPDGIHQHLIVTYRLFLEEPLS
ncbi:MAG: DUF3168 domain-containing protein [Acidobacterium ailaaui]|jgi:hypothetical protein|nr:DUF3168 domain-containing protein [Pseudacidobacterium ailaaui]